MAVHVYTFNCLITFNSEENCTFLIHLWNIMQETCTIDLNPTYKPKYADVSDL